MSNQRDANDESDESVNNEKQHKEPSSLICNPHEHLKVVPKNKWAIVQGRYEYYHYCLHDFDDSGWGCAYRSFQSICSWLKYQGYITRQIPSHKEIQQCLVDIGDKTPKFLGSRQWIGSLELSFCLQTMFGITSKILSSKSGNELAEHARALIYHFSNGGAPVMIGGGQLAHTIIGIGKGHQTFTKVKKQTQNPLDYNHRSGDCQYLILDPHYCGPDNIEEVLSGGWCAWKPASFWQKKDFYNLLLVVNITTQNGSNE